MRISDSILVCKAVRIHDTCATRQFTPAWGYLGTVNEDSSQNSLSIPSVLTLSTTLTLLSEACSVLLPPMKLSES